MAVQIPLREAEDRGQAKNNRGICPLSMVGRITVRVLQKRLDGIAERHVGDAQFGFGRG